MLSLVFFKNYVFNIYMELGVYKNHKTTHIKKSSKKILKYTNLKFKLKVPKEIINNLPEAQLYQVVDLLRTHCLEESVKFI